MTAKELYNGLVSGDISVSNGLALIRAEISLTESELFWVNSELEGYKGKVTVPEYRQLPCRILARVAHIPTGETYDQEIQGEGIDRLDKMLVERYGLSIYKIYVTQGVELIEKFFQGKSQGNVVMRLEGAPGQMMTQAIQDNEFPRINQVKDVVQSSDIAYIDRTLSVIKQQLLKIILKHIPKDDSYAIKSRTNDLHSAGTIFISYCWEDEEHEHWVETFAKDLSSDFEVLFDKNLPFGYDLTKFMEEAVDKADKVLIICTPTYKERADDRTKGVGYEASLISNDIITEQNKLKFIPVIRRGSKAQSYPRFLSNRKGVDMTDDSKYNQNLEELIKGIKII